MEDEDYVDYTDIHDRLCKLANSVNGAAYPGVTQRTTFRDMGIFDVSDSVKLCHLIRDEFGADVALSQLRPHSYVVKCVTNLFLESI